MKGLAAARRVSWGVGDQALSSLTNFLMGILVARTASSADFGAFSLAFAVYILALVLSRGLTGEPLVVRHSHVPVDEWRRSTAGSAGLALAIGFAFSAVVVVLAAIVGGILGEAFIALAIVLPGLLLQDVWRYAFVAYGRPMYSFVCDLAWAAIMLPCLILLDQQADSSLALPILVWGLSALISAGVGMALARLLPSLRRVGEWFRESRDLGLRYATEALISLAPPQVTLFVLGAVAGLSATAALRGAQLLLGPIQVLVIGINLIGVPEGARLLRARGPAGLLRPVAILSLGIAAITAVWGIALSLLPAEAGEKLLGDSWAATSAILVPMTIGYVGGALAYGGGFGLRVLADARRGLRAHGIDATGQVIGGVAGALLGAAYGAAVGLAIGLWAGSVAWWLAFDAAIKARVRATGGEGPGPSEGAGQARSRSSVGQNGAPTHHTIDL